jgi:hypothetical protein
VQTQRRIPYFPVDHRFIDRVVLVSNADITVYFFGFFFGALFLPPFILTRTYTAVLIRLGNCMGNLPFFQRSCGDARGVDLD